MTDDNPNRANKEHTVAFAQSSLSTEAEKGSKRAILNGKMAAAPGGDKPNKKNSLYEMFKHEEYELLEDRWDERLLHQAVKAAGRWAYGIIMVELWALSDDKTHLFRPEAGWWIDPVFHGECGEDCQQCRLVNPSKSDYVPPANLAPGEGLPGALWSEARSKQFFRKEKRLTWRNVKALAEDPFQPHNPRLQLLASLGLGWSAGVDFNLQNKEGIIVFMARDRVDLDRLSSAQNEAYLHAASDHIVAAYALRTPRLGVVEQRRDELDQTLRRARSKILAVIRSGRALNEYVEEQEQEQSALLTMGSTRPLKLPSKKASQYLSHTALSGSLASEVRPGGCLGKLRTNVVMTIKKFRGGGVKAPPPLTWLQTFYTSLGCFCTILILSSVNVALNHVCLPGEDCGFLMGPLGSFMVLLFGLYAAPVAQPRNNVLNLIVGMVVGKLLSFTALSLGMRQVLACWITTTFTVKIGIMHPIGSAYTVTYAGGGKTWKSMGFQIVAYLIAIAMATLINNMSDQRQYPTTWGFGELNDWLARRKVSADKKRDQETRGS